MAGWVGKTTALLEPLADAVGRHVRAGQCLFADDTPVKVLAPGTGKSATARAWVYVRDERPWCGEGAPAAWYRFSADRKARHPQGHLADFRGWMHADGYTGFERLIRAGPMAPLTRVMYSARSVVILTSPKLALCSGAMARASSSLSCASTMAS